MTEYKPKIRPATAQDCEAIRKIVMQKHINPFMSFEELDNENFKPIFEILFKESKIYVMEDKEGQIIGTRRMIFGEGERAHIVTFATLGIDKDHLRNGHATQFYDYFTHLIKEEHPEIERIELTQAADNIPAYKVAVKNSYSMEANFPDWITRQSGDIAYQKKWNVGERFMAKLLADIKPEYELKKFQPQLPEMLLQQNADSSVEIIKNGIEIACFQQQKLLAVCTIETGVRRFDHIQFWRIHIEPEANTHIVEQFLRDTIVAFSQKTKKIEAFTSDQSVIDIAAKLGMHCRGEKICSRKINTVYYNEVGVDFSFFNINDAKKMLTTLENLDEYASKRVSNALNGCQNTINALNKNNQIDEYAKLYLENLAYQMTREMLTETKLYSNKNAPWDTLIQGLESSLKTSFRNLANCLGIRANQIEQNNTMALQPSC